MQVLDCTDQPGTINQQNSGFESLSEQADNAIIKTLVLSDIQAVTNHLIWKIWFTAQTLTKLWQDCKI